MEKFERADPNALADFDPRTKVCTMNCGPTVGDPRSPEERRFLCPDCVTVPVPNAGNAMSAVPKDAPVMTAWNNYKSCDDYQNTRKWALHEEHVDGSLWASFYAGYFACAVDTTSAPNAEPTHPEDFCEKCGRKNIVWFTPNELWNKYTGNSGILCPCCFVGLATDIQSAWKLIPEFYTEPPQPRPN